MSFSPPISDYVLAFYGVDSSGETRPNSNLKMKEGDRVSRKTGTKPLWKKMAYGTIEALAQGFALVYSNGQVENARLVAAQQSSGVISTIVHRDLPNPFIYYLAAHNLGPLPLIYLASTVFVAAVSFGTYKLGERMSRGRSYGKK